MKIFIWLVVVNLFGLAALSRFNLEPDTAYTWITPQAFPVAKDGGLVEMHGRWDTYWYLDIVKNGYYLKEDNILSNVVFFPLYPLLINVFGTILGGEFVLAGWLVSVIFLFLSGGYFYKLVKEFHSEIEDSQLPILLMLIFPTAFFLNVVYTEAMFLFLTLVTFYCSFKKRFYLAGMWAFWER